MPECWHDQSDQHTVFVDYTYCHGTAYTSKQCQHLLIITKHSEAWQGGQVENAEV